MIAEFLGRGARELFLESNSKLTPAITLYESAGFVHAPRPEPSHYERSDVYMVYVGKSADRVRPPLSYGVDAQGLRGAPGVTPAGRPPAP